jgi:hypothetical protein
MSLLWNDYNSSAFYFVIVCERDSAFSIIRHEFRSKRATITLDKIILLRIIARTKGKKCFGTVSEQECFSTSRQHAEGRTWHHGSRILPSNWLGEDCKSWSSTSIQTQSRAYFIYRMCMSWSHHIDTFWVSIVTIQFGWVGCPNRPRIEASKPTCEPKRLTHVLNIRTVHYFQVQMPKTRAYTLKFGLTYTELAFEKIGSFNAGAWNTCNQGRIRICLGIGHALALAVI